MSTTGSLIVYISIWWIVFFSVLPIGIKSQNAKLTDELHGNDPGAPKNPKIAKKFLAPKGKITLMLDELESNMEGTSSLLSSGKLCTFDVYLFAAIGWFGSGFMTTHLTVERLLENRPRLCEICQRVGNLPAVKEFYADPMNKIVMNGAYSKL